MTKQINENIIRKSLSLEPNRRRSSIIGFNNEEKDNLQSFIDLAYDNTLKWKDYSTNQLKIECIRNKDGTTIVRAESIVPINPETFFKEFENWELVKTLDPTCTEVNLLKSITNDKRIVYGAFKVDNVGVQTRDFVYKEMRALTNEEGQFLKMGKSIKNLNEFSNIKGRKVLICCHSLDDNHPWNLPKKNKRVRGFIYVGGYLLEDIGNNKSKIKYLVNVDPKGWIPKFVVNTVAPQQAQNLLRVKEYIAKKIQQQKQ